MITKQGRQYPNSSSFSPFHQTLVAELSYFVSSFLKFKCFETAKEEVKLTVFQKIIIKASNARFGATKREFDSETVKCRGTNYVGTAFRKELKVKVEGTVNKTKAKEVTGKQYMGNKKN